MSRRIYEIIVLALIFFSGGSDARAESNSVSDANRTARWESALIVGVESNSTLDANLTSDIFQRVAAAAVSTFVPDANGTGQMRDGLPDLIKKAEEGVSLAQFRLGGKYYFGIGVKRDYKEAGKWFRKAAEQGYTDAQSILGWMYYVGWGVEKDCREAAKWYRKAAEKGDVEAQEHLGFLYVLGEGVERDCNEAAKWYRKSAEQGYAWAQCGLGRMYYGEDEGVEQDYQDYKEAAKWFRKAAEQDNALAQFYLGVMYAEGKGVDQDYKEATKWSRKAAEQGLGIAQYNLGVMYGKGEGIEKDYKEAAKWYRKAAEQGLGIAQYNLGVMYYLGDGVVEDYVEAYKWALLAGMNGKNVSKLKEWLQEKMTIGQISLAQQRAKEFVESREKKPDEKMRETPERTKFGTGFFITKEGYMLTASHTVRGGLIIQIYYQGKVLTGRKFLDDVSLDVALIKIDDVNCGWINMSPSSEVRAGDEVFTVGYPQIQLQGLGAKYTNGVINSLTGIADDPKYFQISVPVQPGNSGGPLVDSQGRVIGIIVSRLDDIQTLLATGALPQNVNYALKSSFVLALLESVSQIASSMKEGPTKVEKDKSIDNVKSAVALVICSE